MPSPTPPELVYDGSCPYCRAISQAVGALDLRGSVTRTDINTERGRRIIEDHHGEFIDSPHLFTDRYVYYGVTPVAKALGVSLPKTYVGRG